MIWTRTTKTVGSLVTSLALACSLMAAPVLAAQTDSATPAVEKYVAFGDSITAGYEPGMTETTTPYGYVDRLYEQALYHGRAEVTNYGILGLNSTGLAHLLEAIAQDKTVTAADLQESISDPRIQDLLKQTKTMKQQIANATLLTITIGGNDFGATIADKIANMSDSDIQTYMKNQMEVYTKNVTSALTSVFAVNKDVRVYIADQYSPYPPINKPLYDKLQALKDELTADLQRIAASFRDKQYEVHAVEVANAFVGKEGNYLHIAVRDIHPKQAGYDKMAELFATSIWGSYATVTAPTEPITVIVGGKQVETPHTPILVQDSTFVPLREYTEALGATVDWNNETRTASIRWNKQTVDLTIDSPTVVVNGVAKTTDTIPMLHTSADEDKTYIPLRLMAESLGFDVQYVHSSTTAYINR